MRSFLQTIFQQLNTYNVLVNDYQQAIRHAPDHATAFMNWGIRFSQEGNHAQAEEKFSTAATMAPDNPEIFANWGIALVKVGQLEAAIEKFTQAVQLDATNADWYGLLGAAQVEHHLLDEADATYQKALRLNPEQCSLYNSWGIALARRGDYTEAIKKFEQSLNLRRYQPNLHFLWGVILAEQEQYDAAIDRFQKTLRFMPRHGEALHFWCVCLNRLGRYQEAVSVGRQCLEWVTDNPQVYLALGEALFQTQQIEHAQANVRHALLLDDTLAEAHEILGQTLAHEGRLDDAIAAFESALSLEPDLIRVHAHWGQALLHAGREKEAFPHIEQAYLAQPDNGDLMVLWASLVMKQEGQDVSQMDAALAKLFEAAKANDWNPRLHFLLGCHYLERGEYARAAASLKRVLEAEPLHVDGAIQLSLAYCGLYQTDDAVRVMRPLIREKADDPRVVFYYAHMLYRHGDWRSAEEKYKHALALKPQWQEAALGLAECQLMQGRFMASLESLNLLNSEGVDDGESRSMKAALVLRRWAVLGEVLRGATRSDNQVAEAGVLLGSVTPAPARNTLMGELFAVVSEYIETGRAVLPVTVDAQLGWYHDWCWAAHWLHQRGVLSQPVVHREQLAEQEPYRIPWMHAVLAVPAEGDHPSAKA